LGFNFFKAQTEKPLFGQPLQIGFLLDMATMAAGSL